MTETFKAKTKLDAFVYGEVKPLLEEGEAVQAAAYFDTRRDVPGRLAAFVEAATAKGYHTVLTNRRLLFIECRLGALAPLAENKGIMEMPLENVRRASFERSFWRKRRIRLQLLHADGEMLLNCRDHNRHLSTQTHFLDLLEERYGSGGA
jgi:hypothetical protein